MKKYLIIILFFIISCSNSYNDSIETRKQIEKDKKQSENNDSVNNQLNNTNNINNTNNTNNQNTDSSDCRIYASEYKKVYETYACMFDQVNAVKTCSSGQSSETTNYDSVEDFIEEAKLLGKYTMKENIIIDSENGFNDTLTYNYNDSMKLTSFTITSSDSHKDDTISFTYWDSHNRPIAGTYSNNKLLTIHYDEYRNVVQWVYHDYFSNGIELVYNYIYDENYNLLKLEKINDIGSIYSTQFEVLNTEKICKAQ